MYFSKSELPNVLTLDAKRMDIWQFSLLTPPADAFESLNEEEKTRADRFHFERHKRRFIASRYIMRLILARYLMVKPKEIEFNYNAYGKPELNTHPFLQFNLSHSSELGLLAVGKDYPLGIDVEFFSARNYAGIGNHIFSEAESKVLNLSHPSLTPLLFFNLWAQKEALIKACGMGLSYPTKQFDLPLLNCKNFEITDPQLKLNWKITSFMPEPACCAAICYNPAVTEIKYFVNL